jgi:threonine synthase
METTDAFTGLSCVDFGEAFDPETATHRCPDCGGILDPMYDLDRVDLSPEVLTDRPFESMWRDAELLPFARETAVSLGEGATPLVECPALAESGVFGPDDTVVLLNTGAGNKDVDALCAHLGEREVGAGETTTARTPVDDIDS